MCFGKVMQRKFFCFSDSKYPEAHMVSEALTQSDKYGVADIIEDCEALREHLDIPKWSVLGIRSGDSLRSRMLRKTQIRLIGSCLNALHLI